MGFHKKYVSYKYLYLYNIYIYIYIYKIHILRVPMIRTPSWKWSKNYQVMLTCLCSHCYSFLGFGLLFTGSLMDVMAFFSLALFSCFFFVMIWIKGGLQGFENVVVECKGWSFLIGMLFASMVWRIRLQTCTCLVGIRRSWFRITRARN